jgi:hypothetical protein
MTSRAAHRPRCLPFYVSLLVLLVLELGVGVVVRGRGLEKGGKTWDFGGQMLTTHQKFKCRAHPNFTVHACPKHASLWPKKATAVVGSCYLWLERVVVVVLDFSQEFWPKLSWFVLAYCIDCHAMMARCQISQKKPSDHQLIDLSPAVDRTRRIT